MELNYLGFDFSNLSTGTIKKKNQLAGLIFLIVGLSVFPVFIVFTILYIVGASIEINGVLTGPNDPAYTNFFIIFLSIFGLLILLFVFLIVFFGSKSAKKYIVIDRDARNFDTVYYIYTRNEEIYLTDTYFIKYNKKYNNIYNETNKEAISELKEKYLFWNNLIDLEDAKIIQRTKNTVVIKKGKSNYRVNSFRNYTKKYVLSNNINIVPETVIESVYYSSYGKNSYQSRNKYYFENVNRAQHLKIHPEIKKALQGLR